ncbi:NAD(P)-dependent oxidoreductase [Blautia schinkii]|nr:NAD(P)-dependent oxidoreductase [Blautia schinkii]
MKKIIVTGATSMIGVSIIEACLSENISKIYAIVRPNTTKRNRLPENLRITIVECASEEYGRLPELIEDDCDAFYHVAWSVTGSNRNQDIMGQTKNIEYTLDALGAAKKLNCKKFIGTGSQAEYGKLNLDKINETSPVNPVQPYGIAKYAAGKLGAEQAKKLGIDFIWVRIFSVYGRYDKPTTMIASTIQKLLSGEHTSFTAAEQRWDYLYSSDAGRAFYLMGEKSDGNKVYCLGSGQAHPLREYIKVIGNIVNPESTLGIGDIPYSDGTVMNLCADITELRKDTGWYPEISFEDGVKKIMHYMKEKAKYQNGGGQSKILL